MVSSIIFWKNPNFDWENSADEKRVNDAKGKSFVQMFLSLESLSNQIKSIKIGLDVKTYKTQK
jgi:hypothetical protein